MKSVPKQLVIDKDVFRGTSTQSLCDFARRHFLILSDDLYYECASTDEKQQELLDRFRDVILAGGCICPRRNKIIREEAKSLSPYGMLVNMQTIIAVRKTFQKNSRPYKPKEVEAAKANELQLAQMIIDFANDYTRKLASEESERLTQIRKCDSSNMGRFDRLVELAESVDSQDIHHASEEMLKGFTKRPDAFCLSGEWVSWHFLRLYLILLMERTFSRHTGDASEQNSFEHDLQDINYVLLLSRADGLLTRDKNLVIPLAKAAFPKKDVFSNLEEVPEDYLGYWSQN
jgi:hypothetical protein